MLAQDRFGRAIGIVEPIVPVSPTINNLEEGPTVEFVGTTLGDEVDLCDAAA